MLPTPEVGRNDSETIQNLMDTVIRLRKELEHLFQHLDDENIPSLAGIKGDIKANHTAIIQNENEIQLLAAGVAGQSSAITLLSNQISLKVSQGDYTASVIVSMINGSLVTISADRINLNGVTSMSGLALVNSELQIGSTGVNGKIVLRTGIEIFSQDANTLRITVPNMPGSGMVQVFASSLQINFNEVATQNFVTSQGYITSGALSGYATQSWVSSQNYASGNFAISNQGLSIQNYAGHLEIYQGSTFIGKLKYV